jgi:hypothetical protein
MAYLFENLQATITTNLGGNGGVAVELTEDHYRRGIDAALKLLCRYRPMHGYQVVQVAQGGNKYVLTARNIVGVLDCSFFNSGSRLEYAPYYSRWVDRNIERGEMKEAQRAFDDKPEWFAQTEPNADTGEDDWLIYTTITQSSFVDTFARLPNCMAVQFAWYVEPTDDKQVGLNRIPVDMRQWVEDYATARCRMILGDIRNKFGGIPGAVDGSTLKNDGGQQIERAEQTCRELEADLKSRQRQSPLLID